MDPSGRREEGEGGFDGLPASECSVRFWAGATPRCEPGESAADTECGWGGVCVGYEEMRRFWATGEKRQKEGRRGKISLDADGRNWIDERVSAIMKRQYRVSIRDRGITT